MQSDAYIWAEAADRAIADIVERGKRVLVVGGAGLYIKVLLHGLFHGPYPDPKLRAELQNLFETKGGAFLHSRLVEVDPAAAARIHPNDPVRIIRALEVYELTGLPISEQQRDHLFQKQRYPYIMIGLNRERRELHQRIDQRVLKMMAAGWREETEALYQQWGGDVPPFQLIGYREILNVLREERIEEELIPVIQQATRQYAKRQLTWFRGMKDIIWLEASEGIEALQQKIVTTLRSST